MNREASRRCKQFVLGMLKIGWAYSCEGASVDLDSYIYIYIHAVSQRDKRLKIQPYRGWEETPKVKQRSSCQGVSLLKLRLGPPVNKKEEEVNLEMQNMRQAPGE